MSRAPSTTPGANGRSRPSLFGAVVGPIQEFLQLQAAGGIVLLGCALAALAWANLHPSSYAGVFDYPLRVGAGAATASFTLRDLIDDGLMSIFFFVVGMEIKRELVTGELDTLAKATLPAIAAIGGMVIPAAIFLAFTSGGPGQHGWGIPMATDIAFCVGLLMLLGTRVSHALVVFVTALAIFDDIGGILVIALFYGGEIGVTWLLIAAGLAVVLFGMSRARVVNGLAYALVGGALWYALHHGGIHPTIAGVVLGLAIPARPLQAPRAVLHDLALHVASLDRKPHDAQLEAAEILSIEEKLEDIEAPTARFIHRIHPFVAFGIMPLFALANAGLSLAGIGRDVDSPVALGAAAGLFVGKPVGIFAATMLAVKLGLAPLPGGSSKVQLLGVSVIAGIGFTVALFIAGLAYSGAPALMDQAKLGILVASLAAGVVGYAILRSRPAS